MGLLEPITHKEEIENLVDDAQSKYDDAVKRLEAQKVKTANSLEKLGEQKLEAWSGDMQDFLDVFSLFNNVQMVSRKDNLYNFAGRNERPQELMINMQRASMTANEVLKTGALAIGTGALVGIASYGGAMMFAHASTGTAIAALSGAAKTNATLAWFGGGSLAAGGLGKLGGKLVLGGIVVAPILLVAGIITAAKSKEKLAEAKKMHAEAEKAVAQMDAIITGMVGIEKMSENYRRFLRNMSSLFKPFVAEMEKISQDYVPGPDGKICFDDLSEMEQKTLHLSWLLAQLYYHGLSATILTDDGFVAPEAKTILAKSEKEYTAISGEVAKLNKEKEEIRQLLSSAASSFDAAQKDYYDKKSIARVNLANYGKKKIDLCVRQLKPYADALSKFEDIEISNTLHYTQFTEDSGEVYETMCRAISAASIVSAHTSDCVTEAALIEMGAYNVLSFLKEASGQEDIARFMVEADKHDLALWFADELDPVAAEQFIFAGISHAQIKRTENIVCGISGKENLEQAKSINQEVGKAVSKINIAAEMAASISSQIDRGLACFKKTEQILRPFIAESDRIYQEYSNGDNAPVLYSAISESDKKIVELSWSVVKLQYYLLASSISAEGQYGISNSINATVTEITKEIKCIRKETFKMTGVDAAAANIIWRPYAQKMMFVNFGVMLALVAIAAIQLINSNWFGFAGGLSAVIALPIFLYFKTMPQSKLFMWRIIRLVIAIVVFVGIELIGMVG